MSKKVESLLDAFLALKDIDDEEVVSMIKPKKIKESLQEGISVPLNSTQEDFEEAREYLNKPEDEVELEVIDADADSIEHLKDKKDYVGQALLQCIRCRATRFIEMDKLEASEDNDEIYNKEDECPHCKAEGFGFELVGQVGKVENNNEPLTDEDEAKIENDEVNDEEVKFDNDEEVEEENKEEETELEELPETEEEEEINGDETTSHEDDDLLDLPELGDEVEEKEVEEDEEEVQESLVREYKSNLNGYAKKAWMLNKVIEAMNDQEAYYGGWLYAWPDDETEEQCEYDFGNKEDYEELEKEFERIYKKYHEDGLYNASDEVLEFAHKMDDQFDLKPIENLKKVEEVLQDKEEADEDYKPVVSDLLDSVINQDNIKFVVVNGQEVEGIDEDLEAAEFESFNVGEGYLTANIDSEDKESEDKLSVFLDYFNDEETEKVKLVDVQSSEEVFEGTKADAIEKFGDCKFVSFDAPERLELTVKDFEPTNVKDEEKDEEAELVEAICKANGYASYRINNPRTNEYWINESVRSGDDLKTIYTLFVEGLGEELVEQFKRVTGYKTELDIVNEQYGVKNEGFNGIQMSRLFELCRELGLNTIGEIDEFSKAHGNVKDEDLLVELEKEVAKKNSIKEENEVAVVEPKHEVVEMPEEEKKFLNNLGRVANDICDAITKYYGIETDPSLVVADIMQDLSLVAGTIKPEDLEDSPINNLTKEMFNDYNAMEDFVSDVSVMFGGQPLDKTPEARIGRAIRTLQGPSFSTENIFRNIGSNRFIDMANAGQVGFLTGDQVLQLGEACHKKVKESCRSFKTRKELSEAIQDCKNNNWPYRVRRSENEEFRYDLITEEYEDENIELDEAKKDEVELPVDPDAVKAEVHDSIANLVKDEVEAIQGYDEVKAQVADSHIEHADDINDTLEHIKDEEQEHIDELNDLSELIPFEKEEAKEEEVVEEPVEEEVPEQEVIEEPVEEFPVDEEFGFVEDFLDKSDDLFDEVRFDKEMNDYFKENYSEDVTYKTTKGSIDDNGVIVLEGIVKTTDSRSAITFTLTPSKEINEAFQDVEKEEILGGTTIYQVTNDLSDEVMSFSEYKEDFQRDQEFVNKIIDKWIKETKIENLCPCMLDDIAAWEFESHKAAYKQKGMDESHIKNILVSHIPE